MADWLEASEKGGGETGMAQVREYILDFWKCAGENTHRIGARRLKRLAL